MLGVILYRFLKLEVLSDSQRMAEAGRGSRVLCLHTGFINDVTQVFEARVWNLPVCMHQSSKYSFDFSHYSRLDAASHIA